MRDHRVLEELRDILREVLPADAVAPDDDLFDLGFDSLVIARTATRVRKRLGVDLPLMAYFDAGTVAELAHAVAAAPPAPPEDR